MPPLVFQVKIPKHLNICCFVVVAYKQTCRVPPSPDLDWSPDLSHFAGLGLEQKGLGLEKICNIPGAYSRESNRRPPPLNSANIRPNADCLLVV